MLKLMKLELRQNRMKTYLLATIAIAAVLVGFAYLFAGLPHLPTDNELEEVVMELVARLFGNYENIVSITSILSMFCFGVMSSVMLSKFVIEDYKGKRANLLFSYPYDRRQVFAAKVVLVSLFTAAMMLLCNGVVFAVFFTTETIHPLIPGTGPSAALIASTVKVTLVFAVMSVAIGLISLFFAFDKKSVAAMMVPAYILATVFSNILGSTMLISGSLDQSALHIVLALAALAVGFLLVIRVMHKVDVMEAV